MEIPAIIFQVSVKADLCHRNMFRCLIMFAFEVWGDTTTNFRFLIVLSGRQSNLRISNKSRDQQTYIYNVCVFKGIYRKCFSSGRWTVWVSLFHSSKFFVALYEFLIYILFLIIILHDCSGWVINLRTYNPHYFGTEFGDFRQILEKALMVPYLKI